MIRIKKLDIFIAKQFGLLFVGTFFICQFVLMMQFLWRYIDDLIGKGLSMEIMAQFFWYMGLMLVPQALPLAILLSIAHRYLDSYQWHIVCFSKQYRSGGQQQAGTITDFDEAKKS